MWISYARLYRTASEPLTLALKTMLGITVPNAKGRKRQNSTHSEVTSRMVTRISVIASDTHEYLGLQAVVFHWIRLAVSQQVLE